MLFLFLLLCLGLPVDQAVKTSGLCFNTTLPPVYLSCEAHHKIHVVSTLYQKANKNCEITDDHRACRVEHKNRNDGFATSCNGVSSCWEPIQKFSITETCGDVTSVSVSVTYECIDDTLILDVCNTTTALSESSELSMVSPNYYNPVSRGPGRPCSCDVTGLNIDVEILELYLRKIDGEKANLTLTTDRFSWSSEQQSPIIYNSILLQDTDNVKLTIDTHLKYGQMAWIRIRGSTDIKVTCNGGTNKTIRLSPATPGPFDDTGISAVTEETGHMSTVTIISVTCGIIIFLLLAIVISLLIYYGRTRKTKKSPVNYISHIASSEFRHGHGSSEHEYDITDLRQQAQNRDENGHQNSQHNQDINHYDRLDNATREPDSGTLGGGYSNLSSFSYQRD